MDTKDKLNGLEDDQLVKVFNQYCYEIMDADSRIFDDSDLDEFISTLTPKAAWIKARMAKFNHLDKWFSFDGYGNVRGSHNPRDLFDIGELADHIDTAGGLDSYLENI